MLKRLPIWIALCTAGLCAVLVSAAPARAADDIRVEASLERERVMQGERFTLIVQVFGTQSARAPRMPAVAGFTSAYVGSSKQFKMVNGHATSSVSHRFVLTARRTGEFKLGPFQVPHEGKIYTGEAVAISVLGMGQGGAAAAAAAKRRQGPDVQLRVVPTKTELWVGERVPLKLEFSAGDVSVDGIDYPVLEGDGITFEPFGEPLRRSARVDGRTRRFLDFESSMIAVKPGGIDLGPARIEITVADERSRDPRSMFNLGLPRRRKMELTSEPVKLEVRALPTDGRPDDFSGAVGSFDFEVEASPRVLNVGDPVTVRMHVKGTGNLSGLRPPIYTGTDELRAYDPVPLKDEAEQGSYTTEQVVIPRTGGQVELPALTFGYFDPREGRYREITRGPFSLEVGAGQAPGLPPAVVASGAPSPRTVLADPLGRDIVYIKDRPGGAGRVGMLRVKGPAFALAMAFPLLGYAGVLLLVRRRDRHAADPRLGRFGRATKEAAATLSALSSDIDQAGFYDGLTSAVHAYLSAKLDLPPGAVDRDTVVAALDGAGVAEGVRSQVAAFFDGVEQVRYTGSSATGADRRAALELAQKLVSALDKERSLAQRVGLASVVLLALLSAAAVAAPVVEAERKSAEPAASVAREIPSTAADASTEQLVLDAAPRRGTGTDPLAIFFEAGSAYEAGDYALAAAGYEDAVAAGASGGPVYFNLANSYFKVGDLGRAVLNYERALERLPRDPDVRANLDYALEQAEATSVVRPLWKRMAFPLVTRATADEIGGVLLLVWWALWLVLASRLLRPAAGNGLGQAAWAMAVVTVLLGGNLVARLGGVELARRAVVVAADGAVVRYEPSETGAEYFEAPLGDTLDIRDTREGWVKVRRRDGLRGWVVAHAVEPL